MILDKSIRIQNYCDNSSENNKFKNNNTHRIKHRKHKYFLKRKTIFIMIMI